MRRHTTRFDADGSEPGCQLEMPDSAVVETNIGEHRADERANAGFFDLPFHPSRQSDLVVLERDGTGHRLAAAQRAFLREVGDQLVGDAMRDLVRLRAMRIQPDDGADDRPTACPPSEGPRPR